MAKNNEAERQNNAETIEPEEWSPFFDYLQSAQGHELASRIVTLIEEVKKATLDRSAEQGKINMELTHRERRNSLILQGVVFGIAIIAASFLTYFDKFNSTIAVLFGTLVGYFFGRKTTF